MTERSPSPDLYDKNYFDHHMGPVPYNADQREFDEFFTEVARSIVECLGPRRTIDVGCAKGFLVAKLRDRGVEAFGIDLSPYAISQVREDVRPHCRVGSVTTALGEKFDLVTCIEVLEHLPEDDARAAVSALCRAGDDVLFSSSPTDYTEPTHRNVQPPSYWRELFSEQGFYPSLAVDASFVSPSATLFRRGKTGPLEIATFPRDRSRSEAVQILPGIDLIVLESGIEEVSRVRPVLEAARRSAKPVVFELDEADLVAGSSARVLSPVALELARVADFITASTPAIADELERSEPMARGKVHVVPTTIDTPFELAAPPARTEGSPIVIGWSGHSSTERDLELVAPAIAYVLRKYPGRVVFMAPGLLPASLRSLEGVASSATRVDLGIAPLEETRGNHCRSDRTWREYAASRVPAICSSVTPYASAIAHGWTGWLVDNTTAEWVDALERLLADRPLRERLAENAYRAVASERSLTTPKREALHRSFVVSGPRTAKPSVLTLGAVARERGWFGLYRNKLVLEEQLAAEQALRRRVEGEKARVEQELAAVYASRAWHVGTTIGRIYFGARRLVGMAAPEPGRRTP